MSLVTADKEAAYDYWQKITKHGAETMLEDRLNGTVSSQLKDDETGKYHLIDDYTKIM